MSTVETLPAADVDPLESSTPAPAWLGIAYALTIFLSAFLLFQVQPLISKAILPWFGGTPSVWTVCMLFFQTLLFGGYAYSHLVTTRLEPRYRLGLHLVLLVVACVMLPILPSVEWKPTGEEDPTFRIVGMLLATVGLPFFVLSTTGPLLQAWFAGTHPGTSPYRLYSLSNIGSLLALLSYPFVFEPMMGLTSQSATWSWAFGSFAVCCAICGVAALRYRRAESGGTPEVTGGVLAKSETGGADEAQPTSGTMALWAVLATVPSVMLLATTNEVCLDVASVPFLWVLPLSLYLISFILCFDSDRWYSRNVYGVAVLLTSGVVVWALAVGPSLSIPQQVGMYFAALFATSMFCHGELAAMKPHPRYLTQFYLVMSFGGAAGGLLTGLVAPLVFTGYFELHVAILAAACLVFVVDRRSAVLNPDYEGWSPWILTAIVGVLGLGLGFDVFNTTDDVVLSSRNFYGVLRVQEFEQGSEAERKDPTGPGRRLMHGRIVHGKQYTHSPQRSLPTMYYGRTSGVGMAMRSKRDDGPQRVGVVGLGVGTLATYAEPGDTYRFYEINRDVVDIARSHFTYLDDCKGTVETVLADARLALEREEPQNYDVLVVDAFSSDSIPTHLLTREAMRVYLRHLAPGGILALHVSNKHFSLEPVAAAHAAEFDLTSLYVDVENADLPISESIRTGATLSTWILLAAEADRFDGDDFGDHPTLPTRNPVVWTDDDTNLIDVLHIRQGD